MTDRSTASGDGAADVAPEASLLLDLDPVGLGRAAADAVKSAVARPGHLVAAALELAIDTGRAGVGAAAVAAGLNPQSPLPVDARDKRFADPAWAENPGFWALRQTYLAGRRFADRVVGDSAADAKTSLLVSLLFDALAPTNFLLSNPAALKRALDTGGLSVLRGMRNLADDVLTNSGRPRQVDRSGFRIGENLAATPGQVVYRNEMMELIQYAPQTEQVHAVPLLANPPWINKYYVMDLAPDRSFIEWAVRHQRTVFAISYRNPDATMRHWTMDDYLVEGPRTALDIIARITGAPTVDIVGLCLGGALTAITAAYLAHHDQPRLGSLTLLNTLLDYREPGPLGAFVDEATVSSLERKMARAGVLSGGDMATTFDLLRANDLIFNYVVSNWLMGESPPAFDILAWNADNTRMPATMHSFYLHKFYLENALATGDLEIAGQRMALSDIKQDTYIVAAVNDHIVPWTSSYRSRSLLGGDVRFVRSNGGHIAGIVNPPGPKAWYETGSSAPSSSAPLFGSPVSAAQWQSDAQRHAGSWWEDWAQWAADRAGELIPAVPVGSAEYPPLGQAPGRYVAE